MLLKLNSIETVFTAEGKNKHLMITPKKSFKFIHISHRARIVTGLLNVKLNVTYEVGKEQVFDIPIWDYANKLYLVSKQGQSIQSNIGDREYTPSVIGSIDNIIREETFLMVNS